MYDRANGPHQELASVLAGAIYREVQRRRLNAYARGWAEAPRSSGKDLREVPRSAERAHGAREAAKEIGSTVVGLPVGYAVSGALYTVFWYFAMVLSQ